MSNEPAPSAKVCKVCKQDCSARPRQKDKEGRYTCQDCLDKLAQAKAAKAAAPEQPALDPGLAAALVGVDQTAMTPCPNCGVLLKPDTVLCTGCGFDVDKGRALRTRVQELSARERNASVKPEKERRSVNISFEPTHLFVLAVVVFCGLGFWAYSDHEAMPFFLISLVVCYYASMIMMIVGAFKDDDSIWGIVGIASAVVGFSYIGVLYYIFAVSDRGMVKAMTLSLVVGVVIYFGLAVNLVSTTEDDKSAAPPARVTRPAGRT